MKLARNLLRVRSARLVVGVVMAVTLTATPVPARASVPYMGLGFDTCAAPSLSQMRTWRSLSPYASIGIYIGGGNRACGDGNLSSDWVSNAMGMGWRLTNIYVGLQAPCVVQPGLATIDPSQAALQGTQAADDAVVRAKSLGLGPGAPVYFDMEAYGQGCSATVLAFVGAWTIELHAAGYLAGVYGSGSSMVRDESAAYGTPQQVDDIWFADWNGVPNTFADPYLPDSQWTSRQRIHQFQGNTVQTYGGVTLPIDLDAGDGAFSGFCNGQSPTCSTPVQAYYASLGGTQSYLGGPSGPEFWSPDGTGKLERFANGDIFWSPYSGAHAVHGLILDHYVAMGGERSPQRYPVTDEQGTGDGVGRFNNFQNGAIYWTPQTGAWEVRGLIDAHWVGLGAERSVVGYPVSDEQAARDGTGRFNAFQNGVVYWSPQSGAWEVHGAILAHWSGLGAERSYEGYPTSDEQGMSDGVGRASHFQNGVVYWSPQSGAWEVHGAILAHWEGLGADRSVVRYPVSDEQAARDGTGRFSAFQNGVVYWSPQSGAWEVHGAILAHWSALGAERSFEGYPVSDEQGMSDGVGRASHFQYGIVYWSPQSGAWEVHGAILSRYLAAGGPVSALGYPVSDETPTPYGARSAFQHGFIDWYSASGTATITFT